MTSKPTRNGITRRHVLVLTGAGALAAAGAGLFPSTAAADKTSMEAAIKKKIGNRATKSGRITLDLPQIAENGNTVPIGIEIDSPMTGGDYVKALHIFAEANPNPNIASLYFTPASGIASASTRIRLIKSQNIVAVAEMSDGSLYRETVAVKVTIGGCGG